MPVIEGSVPRSGSAAITAELDTLAGAIPLAAEADIATADATDLASAQALANATKAKVNALLAKLRTAGIISAS